VLEASNASSYYCTNYFDTISNYNFFPYFVCPFYTSECGSSTDILTVTNTENTITASNMALGDVCVYELDYGSTNSNLKVWPTSISNAVVTIADGFVSNPLTNSANLNFTSITLNSGDSFELGDSWYNLQHYGKAYLFI
jgi:hypothetical protein